MLNDIVVFIIKRFYIRKCFCFIDISNEEKFTVCIILYSIKTIRTADYFEMLKPAQWLTKIIVSIGTPKRKKLSGEENIVHAYDNQQQV